MPATPTARKTVTRGLLTGCLMAYSAAGVAATTTYTGVWSGGTIAPGDTVVLDSGASVTGNVTADGTLRFNQATTLAMSGTLSGTGTLSLVNSGTLALTGLTSGTGRYDLAISVASGALAIGPTGTNALVIGNSGAGSLALTGGGVANGAGYLGFNAGSVGTATVVSGTWSNGTGASPKILYVGYSGSGSLAVTGGSVTNSTGYIGFNAGSAGSVAVSSGTWQNRGPLHVGGYVGGNGGSGTLTVTGGQVTSTTGYIAANAGAAGTAVISGGTWSTSANLNVGTSGSGTLAISGSGGSGGTVIVGGTLTKGVGGTINLQAGGTLQIGTGSATGVLATDLVNNGALVFNRTGSGTVAAAVSGTGSLLLAGSGTMTFSGASPFTGPTVVNAGSLLVTGTFGTSSVSINGGGLLGGTGAIAGPLTVNAGATVAPGVGIETLAVGAVALLDRSTFAAQVDSSAPLATAADLLLVSGGLSLSGSVQLTLADLAASPAAFPAGTTFSLLCYSGSWNGGVFTFDGTPLADGGLFSSGTQWWMIDYVARTGGVNFSSKYLSGGGFVNLVAVPEPSAATLFGGGGIAIVLYRRRSVRSRP